jgi:hypothetical protein
MGFTEMMGANMEHQIINLEMYESGGMGGYDFLLLFYYYFIIILGENRDDNYYYAH